MVTSQEFPKGVKSACLEMHLSDANVKSLFGLSKSGFAALPKWKKATMRKEHGLA